jgi:hypothetical protein
MTRINKNIGIPYKKCLCRSMSHCSIGASPTVVIHDGDTSESAITTRHMDGRPDPDWPNQQESAP